MNKKILPVISSIMICLLSVNGFSQQQPGQRSNNSNTRTTTTTSKDSKGLKEYKESSFNGHFYDTSALKMVTKEASIEVPAEKGATIQITNSIRNIEIRPWPEAKVKIVTTVAIEEKLAATIKDAKDLLEADGISMRSFGNRVDVQSGGGLKRFESSEFKDMFRSNNFEYAPPQGQFSDLFTATSAQSELRELLTSQNREYWISTGRMLKTMTVFVPEGSKLDINTRNADILINADIASANIRLSHANLDARNFKQLTVIADYYNINISDVEEAELELRNGTFTAGTMANVDLDSENSEIEYSSGSNLYMRSQGDRMMIDEISKVDGRKLYGDLRIGKLLGSIDIEGTNADIKIRNIHQIVEKVKIVDKYADLRLPVKNLKNFTVDFHGENSTVFAGFEKIAVAYNPPEKSNIRKDTDKVKGREELVLTNPETNEKVFLQGQQSQATGIYDLTLAGRHMVLGEKAPVKFTAKEGDVQAKHTKFEIVCHQCSVDFK